MYLTLRNQFNRSTRADVVVTPAEVVLKVNAELVGRFPRQQVRNWLERPVGEMENGRTVLVAVPNGVALGVEDEVPLWPLRDEHLARLRELLADSD